MPITPNGLAQTLQYIGNPNAPLDFWYGPYNDIDTARTATQNTINPMSGETIVHRYVGMTVGILDENGSSITEYWFKNGIEDEDLIPKVPDIVFPTIDELLGNIKIVKFITNAQNQHQNSELTDGSGCIHLPEPTCTNGTKEFLGWGTTQIGGIKYNAGDNVDVSETTEPVFYALWSNTTTYKVTWPNDVSLYYTITCVLDGNTQINNGDFVAAGSNLVFTCTPANGYSFVSWDAPLPDGASTNGNTLTIQSVSSDVNIDTCTVIRLYDLTLTQPSHGSFVVTVDQQAVTVPISNQIQVTPGSVVNIQYSCQDDSYYIQSGGWSVTGISQTTADENNLSFIMPQSDVTVSVTETDSTENNHTVTTIVSPTSSGTVTGAGTYPHNTNVTVHATAANGWQFSRWENNGTQVSTDASYTFTITNDVTLTTVFTQATPDTVNVVVLSGAKRYANTLQNKLNNNEITSTQIQMSSGNEQTISVNRVLTDDTNGLAILTPSNCTVDYIKLFDPLQEELGPNIQVQHGIPRSSADNTIGTKFTLNGVEYDGWVKYTGDNPTTAKILLTID